LRRAVTEDLLKCNPAVAMARVTYDFSGPDLPAHVIGSGLGRVAACSPAGLAPALLLFVVAVRIARNGLIAVDGPPDLAQVVVHVFFVREDVPDQGAIRSRVEVLPGD